MNAKKFPHVRVARRGWTASLRSRALAWLSLRMLSSAGTSRAMVLRRCGMLPDGVRLLDAARKLDSPRRVSARLSSCGVSLSRVDGVKVMVLRPRGCAVLGVDESGGETVLFSWAEPLSVSYPIPDGELGDQLIGWLREHAGDVSVSLRPDLLNRTVTLEKMTAADSVLLFL